MPNLANLAAVKPVANSAPVIVLPVAGKAGLQAQIVGVDVLDGDVIATAGLYYRRSPTSDVFFAAAPIRIIPAAHSLWISIGSASFRTDPAQILCMQDFMGEVEAYAASRRSADNDGTHGMEGRRHG